MHNVLPKDSATEHIKRQITQWFYFLAVNSLINNPLLSNR